MNLTEAKPLQPLSHGSILIVGGKASNFDEELRTHPRIIMWDSQHEHWTGKELPQNVQAVFITRFIGHVAFGNILRKARKKRITIFNPEGTGMIVKQVRELLAIKPKVEEPTMPEVRSSPMKGHSKLNPLMQFLDPKKTVTENARFLYAKAKEHGIETTMGSITQKISLDRRRASGTPRKVEIARTTRAKLDVAVEILDNVVKELQDMRDYLVATTEENKALKLRIERFKKILDND